MGMVSSLHAPERLYTDLPCEQGRSVWLMLMVKLKGELGPDAAIKYSYHIGKTDSPVELVEIILSHQPEVRPEENQ